MWNVIRIKCFFKLASNWKYSTHILTSIPLRLAPGCSSLKFEPFSSFVAVLRVSWNSISTDYLVILLKLLIVNNYEWKRFRPFLEMPGQSNESIDMRREKKRRSDENWRNPKKFLQWPSKVPQSCLVLFGEASKVDSGWFGLRQTFVFDLKQLIATMFVVLNTIIVLNTIMF